jgi:eukaryotic-like serine/threonine-protein kinase
MKCLEKDRARRYDTANGLAMDIQRHLNSEPVLARPPSAVYRVRKAFRRHKLAFSAGVIVAMALILGVGASLWQAREARAAQAAAEQARLNELEQRMAAENALAEAQPAGGPSEPRQDTYDDLQRMPVGVAR